MNFSYFSSRVDEYKQKDRTELRYILTVDYGFLKNVIPLDTSLFWSTLGVITGKTGFDSTDYELLKDSGMELSFDELNVLCKIPPNVEFAVTALKQKLVAKDEQSPLYFVSFVMTFATLTDRQVDKKILYEFVSDN